MWGSGKSLNGLKPFSKCHKGGSVWVGKARLNSWPGSPNSKQLLSLFLFGGFPKFRATFLGVPHNKDCSISGSILGSTYFGKLSFLCKIVLLLCLLLLLISTFVLVSLFFVRRATPPRTKNHALRTPSHLLWRQPGDKLEFWVGV